MKKLLIATTVLFVLVLGVGFYYFSNKEKELGVIYSGFTNSSVTVSSTVTTVLSANSGREYARIFNACASPVYISFGASTTLAINSGYPLAPSSTLVIDSTNLYTGIVSATSSVENCILPYVEK